MSRRTQSAAKAFAARGTSQSGLPDTVYLGADGDTITEATFETYGCTSAIACGSYLTEWLKGRTTSEAKQFDWDELAVELDLPLGLVRVAQNTARSWR